MRFSRLIAPFLTLTFALPAFAQSVGPSAGTDAYLVAHDPAAVSDKGMPTEDRQAFGIGTSLSTDDPSGDVLTRDGSPSTLHQAWADITNVTWQRDDAKQVWKATVTFADVVPKQPEDQTQLTVYADLADKQNSPPDGVRGNMDADWSIKYSDKYGWGLDFRWYNPKPDYWAQDKKTQAVPEITAHAISLSIPFAELPANWSPRWRVMMALQGPADTQIDVVPGVGFPSAKAPVDAHKPLPLAWIVGLTSAALVALFFFLRKRKA